MRSITILGSTGSIGRQTIDVVRQQPERFRVAGLAAGRNVALLAEQIEEMRPSHVVVAEESDARLLRARFSGLAIDWGSEALCTLAGERDVDVVVSALVGFAGLLPTAAAARAGRRIALANKESLVAGGSIVTRLAAEHGAELLPVDSEHSAIFQCLVGENSQSVERLLLTASGGPFRSRPVEEFETITAAQALRHPNWTMGSKITIDSATLMNKGLEMIEARWLFDIPAERIDVVVHPQSIIHSMVQFVDGSIKAQLGLPDMRLPIGFALGWPDRLPNTFERAQLPTIGSLTFEEPDTVRFPCLRLAYDALARGGTAPAVLNAANEVAVAAFLAEQIGFCDIPRTIERALTEHCVIDEPTLEQIVEADTRTRADVRSYLDRTGKRPIAAGQ